MIKLKLSLLLALLLCTTLSSFAQKIKLYDGDVEITVKSNLKTNVYKNKTGISNPNQVQWRREGNQVIFTDFVLKLPCLDFSADWGFVDKQFYKLLDAKNYPMIVVRIISLYQKEQKLLAKINLTLKDVSKDLEVQIEKKDLNPNIQLLGKNTIFLDDFNLKPQKMGLGLVKVDSNVQLDINLFLSGDTTFFKD